MRLKKDDAAIIIGKDGKLSVSLPKMKDDPTAFYNENDPYPAQWLRNLVAAGHIASGHVDERSIADVKAEDLAGYTQAHFFAGIGTWSHALRLAGWPDDRPVWTGSCPCQPFSAAGRRGGTDDPRHLWPEWFRLIRECRPPVIFGEQVASGDGLAWLDIVFSDLEGAGYSVGALDLCAAGFGAPLIRQRLYFVAVADGNGDAEGRRGRPQEAGRIPGKHRQKVSGSGKPTGAGHALRALAQPSDVGRRGRGDGDTPRDGGKVQTTGRGASGLVADAHGRADDQGIAQPGVRGSEESREVGLRLADPLRTGRAEGRPRAGEGQIAGGGGDVGDPERARLEGRESKPGDDGEKRAASERAGSPTDELADAACAGQLREEQLEDGGEGAEGQGAADTCQTGPRATDELVHAQGGRCEALRQRHAPVSGGFTNGFWADAVWLPCSDGKARPTEPGLFPLAHRTASRVGRLRAYGNAIVAPLAAEFIKAYMSL